MLSLYLTKFFEEAEPSPSHLHSFRLVSLFLSYSFLKTWLSIPSPRKYCFDDALLPPSPHPFTHN